MSATDLTRTSRATPQQLWRVLTDFASYGDWIPLTTMRTDAGAPRLGWGFAGLSGVGPLRFADSMVLTRWDPPGADDGHGTFRVAKTGRVLSGWAHIEVGPADGPAGARSTVRWQEHIIPRPLPVGRLLDPLSSKVTERMFAAALDAMVARADAAAGRAE